MTHKDEYWRKVKVKFDIVDNKCKGMPCNAKLITLVLCKVMSQLETRRYLMMSSLKVSSYQKRCALVCVRVLLMAKLITFVSTN